MQGICDARGSFLDVEIRFPGSALDYFEFDKFKIKSKLETEGFLKTPESATFGDTYCLFGDNAYIQKHYMCSRGEMLGRASRMLLTSFTLKYESTSNVLLVC